MTTDLDAFRNGWEACLNAAFDAALTEAEAAEVARFAASKKSATDLVSYVIALRLNDLRSLPPPHPAPTSSPSEENAGEASDRAFGAWRPFAEVPQRNGIYNVSDGPPGDSYSAYWDGLHWRSGITATGFELLPPPKSWAPLPPPPLNMDAREPSDDILGEQVRIAWVEWAKLQPNPKPSWLVPWSGLGEADRDADRRIGRALYDLGKQHQASADAATIAGLRGFLGRKAPELLAEFDART